MRGKKHRKKITIFGTKQILYLIFIFVFLFMLPSVAEGETTISNKEISSEGSLTATISYELKEKVEGGGQYIGVNADVANLAEDFHGNFQVMIVSEYDNKTMYQKKIEISAGESKHLSIQVPAYSELPVLNVKIVDQKNKTMFTKDIKIKGLYDLYSGNAGGQEDYIKKQVGVIPKVGKYILVLVLYILIIGPGVYFVLKMKDKRHYIWVIVPMVSLVFTVIIYGLGSDTRVNGQYMGYLSYLSFDQNKEATNDVIFSVASPQNKKHSVVSNSDYAIIAMQNRYYDDANENINNDYKTSILYHNKQTTIEMKNYPSFASVYFKATSNTKTKGEFESSITYYDYKLNGSFTNHTGLDIENAVIACNNMIIGVGDIANDETIQLDEADSEYIPGADGYFDTELVKRALGFEMNKALMYYMSKNFNYSKNPSFLIGTITTKKKAFVDDMGLSSNGIQAIVIPINSTNTVESSTFVPDIATYSIFTEEDTTLKRSSTQFEQRYKMPITDKITGLMYLSGANYEFKNIQKGSSIFDGTVKAYNYVTKKYDLLFTSGEEAICTELSQYLNEENILQLLYELNMDSTDMFDISLPVLAVRKEVR